MQGLVSAVFFNFALGPCSLKGIACHNENMKHNTSECFVRLSPVVRPDFCTKTIVVRHYSRSINIFKTFEMPQVQIITFLNL